MLIPYFTSVKASTKNAAGKINFPYRYRVLILIFFLTFICKLDRVAISLVGVRIKSAFHLNNEQFGWVISAFALAYAIFEIPSGRFGDRIGQRAVLIRIVLCWSLFTALTGAATGLLSLLFVRFLFGAGEAGAWPNGTAIISKWFPANETSRAYSWLSIGGSVGAAVAPLIVVPIAAVYGWRVPFFMIGSVGLFWIAFCATWFRNNPSEKRNISIEELNYIETNRPVKSGHDILSWKTVSKSRNVRGLSLSFFGCMFGWTFFVYWLPVYLQEGRHISETDMKTISSIVFIAGGTASLITGFLSDWLVKTRGLRFSRRLIGMMGLGMAALLLFISAVMKSNSITVIALTSAFFFIVSSSNAFFATCIDIGGNNVGFVSGIMNTCGQMAGFFVGIIVGKIVDITHNFNSPLFVVGGVLIAGSMVWLTVDPNKKLTITGQEKVTTDKLNAELVVA
jgi:MFS family permease